MKIRLFFIFIALLLPSVANAQATKTLDDLNREKTRLLALIEQNNKMMEEYANRRDNEMMRISVVDDKIAKRQALIQVYTSEIQAYNTQIRTLNSQIDSVGQVLKRQKEEYAEMLRKIQARGGHNSPLAYILSSKSFSQSYQRYLFLRQYSEYRKDQFRALNETKEQMAQLKGVVNQKLTAINISLAKVNDENNKLSNELKVRKANVESITQSQTDLKKNIESAQRKTKEIEEKIVAVIREEAERARREAEEAKKRKKASTAKDKAKKSEIAALDALSDEIKENKGRLPWPVRSWVLTSAFGEHDHPLVPSIKISNNGIDMDILASNAIHPVHKGKVSRVIVIPGSCATIIIRHGDVLTVYSNLAEVYVKKDQPVDTYTNLGKVYNGGGINSNILHFELWLADKKQNPEDWLKKQ
ncbi:MAG: peptidoglycan DD-metalloendopeptidase family protein [Bacteroidales bacterium]|nr:peptidoglycan DD-metalloendopeptidase family protein [Bacteroidales bacterium]